MSNISAKIIADSISFDGNRLTTYVLRYPRFIHAEFMTHRVLSKNSASSRAIPFKTMVASVMEDPAIPLAFQKHHSGMQGTEYLVGEEGQEARNKWLQSRDAAVQTATALYEHGVTKQLCNRILEPFLMHTIICSGTEYRNFFALRAHPDAEIHINDLAEKMLKEYNESTPKLLNINEWHIPFGDRFDDDRIASMLRDQHPSSYVTEEYIRTTKLKIATARCGRISYNSFDGKDDYTADLKLHDRLVSAGHWSPFEHCAQVSADIQIGNFKGWKQYRKTFENENRNDPRVGQGK